jgi:ParE toxin of type II toxin-antitoxin system, parDE
MIYRIIFGANVESDLTEAFDYYEQQVFGLGSEFLLAVDAAIHAIKRNPNHFRQVYNTQRKANLKRFPFGVFFIVKKQIVIILAIIHLTRDPMVWKSRKR